MLIAGHAASADVDFSQISDGAKIDFLEATYEDALGACDRVVGRPNVAPYPNDAIVVANRLFDLVLAPVMSVDPLSEGTDIDLNEMLLTEAGKTAVRRTLSRIVSVKYPTLDSEVWQSEACYYLRVVLHGSESELSELSGVIVDTISQ